MMYIVHEFYKECTRGLKLLYMAVGSMFLQKKQDKLYYYTIQSIVFSLAGKYDKTNMSGGLGVKADLGIADG